LKGREIFNRHEQLDCSRFTRDAADQPVAFEGDEHLVNRGWRDEKEALEVGFCRRSPIEQRVGVDEGQVLALGFGESR
jgi:hypothetical protein